MDLATLIGLIGGMSLFVMAMMMGSPLSAFVNGPGLLVVCGGTLAALFVKESLKAVLTSMSVMLKAFFGKSEPAERLIPLIVELSGKARKEGLMALEGTDIPDDFLARGVQLGVDGLTPEVIKTTLLQDVASGKTRHVRGQKMFRFLAATAPAMGMIGTLIGLVQMLGGLEDPSAIGPAMAVALLTTLYGAILAFLIFGPIADKLEQKSGEEVSRKLLAISGVESILNGDSSMVIQSKLEAFLAPKLRGTSEAS